MIDSTAMTVNFIIEIHTTMLRIVDKMVCKWANTFRLHLNRMRDFFYVNVCAIPVWSDPASAAGTARLQLVCCPRSMTRCAHCLVVP